MSKFTMFAFALVLSMVVIVKSDDQCGGFWSSVSQKKKKIKN